MTLRPRAKVQPTQNFFDNLVEVEAFFTLQDADSAALRMSRLRRELREMVKILRWSPASGRPARFLQGLSAQGKLRLERVQRLASETNLPMLREYVVSEHLILYAHSDVQVLLLSLRHQRQLGYSVGR